MKFDNIIDKNLSVVKEDKLFKKYTNEIQGFKLFENDNVTYFSNKKKGVLFIFNELNDLTTIHFYGEGHKEYSFFKDKLPYDINLNDSCQDIEEKFGKYEINRGGGEVLPFLGKSNNWIMYLIETNCYRFEFNDEKIYLITLSNKYPPLAGTTLSLIPKKLQHFIELAEEWGINDDGYRDEKIESSSTENLLKFIESFTDNDLMLINAWLSDEKQISLSTDEYVNYTCFLMAYEYAKAVIKSREYN